jgi:hypothetical protein
MKPKNLILIILLGLCFSQCATQPKHSTKKKNDCGCPTFSGTPQKKRH